MREIKPTENQSEAAKADGMALLVISLAIVLAVCAGFGCWAWTLTGSSKINDFGGSFGALNALFSGLAFAAFVFTVTLQRKELSLQRDELALTREELRGQRMEMAMQNKTANRQAFETTFFRMLELLHTLVSMSDMPSIEGGRTLSGRAGFEDLAKSLEGGILRNSSPLDPSRVPLLHDHFSALFREREHALSHYLRSLSTIFDMLETSEIENKGRYLEIFKGQLSNPEVLIIAMVCACQPGQEYLKARIEKYALLELIGHKSNLTPWLRQIFSIHSFNADSSRI